MAQKTVKCFKQEWHFLNIICKFCPSLKKQPFRNMRKTLGKHLWGKTFLKFGSHCVTLNKMTLKCRLIAGAKLSLKSQHNNSDKYIPSLMHWAWDSCFFLTFYLPPPPPPPKKIRMGHFMHKKTEKKWGNWCILPVKRIQIRIEP